MVIYNSGLNGVTVTNTPTVGQVLEALSTTTASWQSGGGGPPTGAAGGDLGGSYPNPTVTATHLSAALPLAQGGTGAVVQNFTGLMTPAAVKTGAYNAAAGDFVPVDTTSGPVTVTLPTAPADLTVIGIKMVTQGGTNTVTYACGGSDVLNKTGGATSGTLTLLAQGVVLQYKAAGAIWYVYADDLPLSQLDLRYLQLAGGTMTGPITMGTSKITGLGNGSGAQDAAAFGQVPVVEGTVGNIKAASTAAALGSSGKWPNSDHVHVQNYGGIFGTGADGSVTFDGSTTVLGLVPAASVYTMTRDIMCTSITINNGVTLKPGNFRIFCAGTVTNNGTISALGNNASAGTAGASGGSGSFTGGRVGGNGGTGVSGTGQNGSNAVLGATGGGGGAGTSGAAGSGGTVTLNVATVQNNVFQLPFAAAAGIVGYQGGSNPIGFGAGGGGGGSDASSNAGGGGGGGGGVVAIFAWAVNNGSGTITAAGGAGANGTAGNAGGGGGGAGGLIAAYTLTAWTAGTTSVTGGNKGTKAGTGSDGSNGGNGLALNVVLL